MDGGGRPAADDQTGASPLSETLPAPVPTPTGGESLAAVVSRRDARAQMLLFVWTTLAFVAFGVVLVLLVGGDRTAKHLLLGAIAFTLACYGALLWAARRPSWEAERTAEIMGWGAVVPTGAALYFFGIASAYVGFAVLGIFLYARIARRPGWAVGAYLAGALPHAVLAALMAADVLRDPGLVTTESMGLVDEILLAIAIQGLFALAFMLARVMRAQTLRSREELERATRVAAQQEALLAEVRQEAALALGVGGPGPFTGRVLGSFELGVVIGRGAMGEVYEGTDTRDAREVAVKVLHRHMLGDASHVERFDREARAAFSLSSPHVVSVLEAADATAPVPYLAMERLRGEDLAQRLRDRKTLPLAEVVELGRQVARGLEVARERGIVHRDLKPSNLFATSDGDDELWKILDFGVAKLIDQAGTLTHQGVVGTPVYMAPEQAQGRAVDHRADVYALAAIFYRALTGRPPFSGHEPLAVLYRVAGEMPIRPGAIAELAPEVDAALALGLAKSADARYATASELVDALAAARDGALPEKLRARAKRALARWPWMPGDEAAPAVTGT